MRLALGDETFDLTARALVMGVTGGDDLVAGAAALVAQGADLLAVRAGEAEQAIPALVDVVGDVRRRFGLPLVVETSRAAVAAAGYRAGAAAGADRSGLLGADLVAATARAGATLVVAADGSPERVCERLVEGARRAEAAGIPPERIVLDPAVDRAGSRREAGILMGEIRRLAALGYPVALSPYLTGDDDPLLATVAAASLGVAWGCRVVRTTQVRAVRRVRDVLAAVLEAR
jgi:dihydropteroate synthase